MNTCVYINLKSCEVHKPTTQVSFALKFSYQKNTYLKFSYIGFFLRYPILIPSILCVQILQLYHKDFQKSPEDNDTKYLYNTCYKQGSITKSFKYTGLIPTRLLQK